jgi:hypothetical protein
VTGAAAAHRVVDALRTPPAKLTAKQAKAAEEAKEKKEAEIKDALTVMKQWGEHDGDTTTAQFRDLVRSEVQIR